MLHAADVKDGTFVHWHAPSLVGDSWSCPGRIHDVEVREGQVLFKVLLLYDLTDATAAIDHDGHNAEMRLIARSKAVDYVAQRIRTLRGQLAHRSSGDRNGVDALITKFVSFQRSLARQKRTTKKPKKMRRSKG